jgi:hypothetical protein
MLLHSSLLTMAALEAAIQGHKSRRMPSWMGGSSPPMESLDEMTSMVTP